MGFQLVQTELCSPLGFVVKERFTAEMYDIWARLILPCTAEYLEFLLRNQWGNAEVNNESSLQF